MWTMHVQRIMSHGLWSVEMQGWTDEPRSGEGWHLPMSQSAFDAQSR